MVANHWRRFSAVTVLGVTVLTAALTACGSTSTASGPFSAAKGCKKIGVLLPESNSSDRWVSKDTPLLQQEITAAIPGAQITLTNANNDADLQQTQAESDLTKGDCILVVAPQDAVKSATIVNEAMKDHVPVIAYDRLIQDKNTFAYVSFDGVAVGKLQGSYIATNYQKYVTANGNNNVVMINGAQTDNNALLFKQGAHDSLDPLFTSNALKLSYETFTPNWDNPTAQTEMEGALTQLNNKIAIAYVANDGMAGTVIQALKAQGLAGKVLVTGQDATAAGITQILLGNQSMTVYKAIDKEAKATAEFAAALSNGTSTASLSNGATTATTDGGNVPSVLETPVAVDLTNIASTVLADGYVTKDEICVGVPAGTDGIC